MPNTEYYRNRHRIRAVCIAGMMMIVIKCFIGFKVTPSIPLLLLEVVLDPVFWFFLLICVDHLTYGRKKEKSVADLIKSATE